MRKIIDGILYDTDASELVAEHSWGEGPRDFHYYAEELHRKDTGAFFLYGEGGPLSKYAIATGMTSWSGGEKIIPMTDDEARRWLELHDFVDEYIALFGNPDEPHEDEAAGILDEADEPMEEEPGGMQDVPDKEQKDSVGSMIRQAMAAAGYDTVVAATERLVSEGFSMSHVSLWNQVNHADRLDTDYLAAVLDVFGYDFSVVAVRRADGARIAAAPSRESMAAAKGRNANRSRTLAQKAAQRAALKAEREGGTE